MSSQRAELDTVTSTLGLMADATAVWGSGWKHLSPRQKAGELAIAAIDRLAAQDESIDPARIVERLNIYANVIGTMRTGVEYE